MSSLDSEVAGAEEGWGWRDASHLPLPFFPVTTPSYGIIALHIPSVLADSFSFYFNNIMAIPSSFIYMPAGVI